MLPPEPPQRPEPFEVDPVGAVELLRTGAVLLDVREADEWRAGHAPEAQWLPMSRLAASAGALPTDRLIVCVCHLGGRSAAVTAALRAAGRQAVNLQGGMAAWAAAGLPVVDDGGQPGSVI